MPADPEQIRRLNVLYDDAEKANAQGEKEIAEKGYISELTQAWIQHAEDKRDKLEEEISPPNALASWPSRLTIRGGREAMAPWADVRGEKTSAQTSGRQGC
jgi:hypothetical protein